MERMCIKMLRLKKLPVFLVIMLISGILFFAGCAEGTDTWGQDPDTGVEEPGVDDGMNDF
jgi:hypothetical protein